MSDVAADQDKDFTFTIELKAGSNAVTGKYDAAWKLNGTTVTVGKVTFGTDGKATIKLHGKETVELTGLPVGTAWKVTETVETDYDTTIKVNGTDKTEAADTISAADEKDVAAFTNTRKTGELTLKKTVESPVDEDNSKDYTFTITLDVDVNGTFTATGAESSVTFTNGVAEVKLAADENITIKGLPANVEYTVVEDAEAYMVTGSTGEAGTIPAEDKAEVAFTNKRDQGELEITKIVESTNDDDHSRTYHITVTMDEDIADGQYGELTFTDNVAKYDISDNETITATDLPAGITYKVEEETLSEFTVIYGGETGVISTEIKAEAKITNIKNEGGLALRKRVTSAVVADHEATWTFKVELDDTSISGREGTAGYKYR